jgi:mono/diheme cytochrome c family protein
VNRRKILLLGLFLLLVLLGGAATLAALLLHDGVSAAATPTKLEAVLARNARRLATPANASAMVNPMPPSEQNLRDARLHFADHCAVCHGNNGSGETMLGRGMYPKPPDLRLPETQNLSDGELYWIIEHGVRFTGMPSFSSHGDMHDSWTLVLFIRHLPQLTTPERTEMDHYNPKGPDERDEERQENDFLNQSVPAAPKHPKAP